MASPAADDYLKTVYAHTEWQDAPITPSVLAAKLGIAPSSVTEMVKKLAAAGLVSHVPYGAVRLTDAGTQRALAMVRRHRLIETPLPLAKREIRAALAPLVKAHALGRARNQGFYRLLNRMLFRAAEPTRRHLVLQRFYRLPQPLIERFYAGRTTLWDIARILVGKPPVPVSRALPCLMEQSLLNPKVAQ